MLRIKGKVMDNRQSCNDERFCAGVARFTLIWVLVFGIAACSGEADKQSKKGADKGTLVEVAKVVREHLAYVTERTGSLRAQRQVKLFSQEEGRVMEVRVREGDKVQEGQLLVRLDDRVLRAEYDKAVASLKQARQDAQRLAELKAKKLVSEEAVARTRTTLEIAEAEERLLKTRLGYILIKAPFAGEIAGRFIEPGDVAPKHTQLLTLVDSSQLITDVQVSELALPDVKIGDPAEVQIDALGGQKFKGEVSRIHPTVDSATRLGRVEVTLKPVPTGARSGQFCRVALVTAQQPRLVVPASALRRGSSHEYVYLLKGDVAQEQAVRTGLRLTDKVEILDGLKEGDMVVIKGFMGLGEGKKVTVVNMPKEAKEKGSAEKGDKTKSEQKVKQQ